MDNLFDVAGEQKLATQAPLAARMRPKKIEDVVGQEHIIGKGKLLRRAIDADKLSSVIFYGPPGCGKTTLAKVIAANTKCAFISLSAITSGIGDVRDVIEKAKKNLGMYGTKTVLFIDEIHRFNKAQQDGLLPACENGTIILIGATTENPYFQVNSALLSRSRIFRLEALKVEDIVKVIKRALNDKENGLGQSQIQMTEEAMYQLAILSSGDVRTALNGLELGFLTTPPDENGVVNLDLDVVEESIQKKIVQYDKDGDWHYDVISAFIKSIRGSDPDAVLHWLAMMIEAGEKPEFIARRIIISAAEDIGLADPQALVVAMGAAQAVNYLGWPEARIPLAEAAVYLACAPKSNSAYLGIEKALADIKTKQFSGVPMHLRDTHYPGAAKLGHGTQYLYAHNYPNGYVQQQYLPDELKDTIYYVPKTNGQEKERAERLQSLDHKIRK